MPFACNRNPLTPVGEAKATQVRQIAKTTIAEAINLRNTNTQRRKKLGSMKSVMVIKAQLVLGVKSDGYHAASLRK